MTQILNRSQQQEKDQREDVNVSFKSESRLPSSYKLDKELNNLYSQLASSKKKLSTEKSNLYGKQVNEKKTDQSPEKDNTIQASVRQDHSLETKLHTIGGQRWSEKEPAHRDQLEKTEASFRSSKRNPERSQSPNEKDLYMSENERQLRMRQSYNSTGSIRIKDIYIDTAPALLGDQSPIDLHDLYNDRANEIHQKFLKIAQDPEALIQSLIDEKKKRLMHSKTENISLDRKSHLSGTASHQLSVESQFPQERLYLRMYDIAKEEEVFQQKVTQVIKEQANKKNISENSQRLMWRRLGTKIETILKEIDKDGTKKINFGQLGRIVTVLGIFKHIIYDENFELEASNPNETIIDTSQKRSFEEVINGEMMIHEQLWLLLSGDRDAETVDADLITPVFLLLLSEIKVPVETLAIKIQECILEHRKNFQGENDGSPKMFSEIIADVEKDQWSILELIKRLRKLKETRLAYTSTGYLRPAKVEEREKFQESMTFKPYVSDNSQMIDAVKTHRFIQSVLSKENAEEREKGEGKHDSKKKIDRLIKDFREVDKSFQKNSTMEPRDSEAGEEPEEQVKNSKLAQDRVELLFKREELRKKWVAENQKRKQQEELRECTFHPTINKSARSSQTSNKNTFTRLYNHDKVQKKREEKALMERVEKETKELEECTFHPKIYTRSQTAGEPAQIPKGYEKSVGRLRFGFEIYQKKKDALEKHSLGENYEKLRNQKVKPFSFLEQERKRRKVPFVYIDVNVGPGRSGRIGLHEDDDPIELARNFALAFQLNQEMYASLEELLSTQLESYKAQQQQQQQPVDEYVQEEDDDEEGEGEGQDDN